MEKEPETRQSQTAVPPTDVLPLRILDALGKVQEKALQSDALTRKVKELIALATSVATRCETSIAYHLHNALEAGATREEMVEAVEVAVVTMGEPAAVHASRILRALDIDEAEHFADDVMPAGMEAMRQQAAAHPYMSAD